MILLPTIDVYEKIGRFRFIEHDDGYIRYIKYGDSGDIIIMDRFIRRLNINNNRYLKEGEMLEK